MKKILMILILMICVLSFSAAAQTMTQISLSADVRISFVNQEPDPAEPGRYVDVRFKVENNGSKQAKDFTMEILPQFPFSLDPGVSAVEKLGALNSRQFGENAVIIKYRLRIDKDAVDGENKLKIRYKFEESAWVTLDQFIINIQTHNAILSVDSVSVDEESLKPGSSSVVKIKLTNNADSILKDIRMILSLNDKPFIPLDSTNEKSVYQIDKKQSYEFRFNLLANPEAKSGVYQIPISIKYSDELGKTYLVNNTIGLIVNAEPDLSVTLDKSEIFESGASGSIIVKVVNKGVTDIKFMNVKLAAGDEYNILSNDESYIGNIDSDDYETADFKLFVKKSDKNGIKLPLMLEYKDANNNEFKQKINLTLALYSASEAKKLGLVKGNGTLVNFILIVLVVAGAFIYLRWKKRKKKSA